jgi:hypothetical protein
MAWLHHRMRVEYSRLNMANFLRTLIGDGIFGPALWGWGSMLPPFHSISTPLPSNTSEVLIPVLKWIAHLPFSLGYSRVLNTPPPCMIWVMMYVWVQMLYPPQLDLTIAQAVLCALCNFYHTAAHASPAPLIQLSWARCRSGPIL